MALRYLQLPLQFDPLQMARETLALDASRWKAHYNTKHYTGDWSIIPLIAPQGDPSILFSTPPSNNPWMQPAPTPFLLACPYIESVLNSLPAPVNNARLMYLAAGAVIKPHSDMDLSDDSLEVRLHMPIITHEDVFFYVQGERVKMDAGTCWFLNLSLEHWVENKSNQPRIHLVVDVAVNEALRAILSNPDHPQAQAMKPKRSGIPKEQAEMIIAELRRQNTPTSNQLADEMLAELNSFNSNPE